MTLLVTLDRDRPLHPWLRTPDELVDQVRPRPVRQVYRWSLGMGWGDDFAASWAAWTVGLRRHYGERVFAPWSMRELEHVLFLRDRVDRGRLGGPRDGER